VAKVTFRRWDGPGASAQRETVARIHRDAYADQILAGVAYNGEEAYADRFDACTVRLRFELLMAFVDEEPVGQTWGWALGPTNAWWVGLLDELDPEFTRENGKRTFGLAELMVRREWTGQGIAHALHDELLRGRSETRASLLVDPGNTRAYRAYTRWGWRKVGQLRPAGDRAPTFDALILPLPLAG
jgi:GNAT superfamily N-acetyltransferase